MSDVDELEQQHLNAWATAVLEQVLVKAAMDIHRRDEVGGQVEVSLTFCVSSQGDLGRVDVLSPGARGKAISVEVPVPSASIS